MKPVFTIFLSIIIGIASAQKRNVYFLKNDGQEVSIKDSADYIRIVSEPDSGSTLYNVLDYYTDQHRKLIGKSSTIDPVTLQGQCLEYFKSGGRKAIHNYQNGNLVDDEFLFFPNGKLYQVRKYPSIPTKNLQGDFSIDCRIEKCCDSLGIEIVTNGNGYYKGYDDSFKNVNEEGPVANGLREGTWKGYQAKNRYVESYLNGNLQTGKAIYQDSTVYTYKMHRGTTPRYQGGFDAFYQYLGQHIVYPYYAQMHLIQGKVIIGFIVEKDGKVSHTKILRSVSREIDEEALRVMNHSPNWIPGTMFGQNVRVQYSLPIMFALK